MRIGTLLIGLLAAIRLPAQTLQIYSEFQRVDPFGQIIEIDRALRPREILSPAAPRNAFTSFHVVVTAPPKTNYFLYVVTNPADAFRITLYKEQFVKTGDSWIPDTLTETQLPSFGAMPDAQADIPGQIARAYLLDIWVSPDTPVGRVRLEVLLKVGYWIISPMEVRVISARVPTATITGASNTLAAIERRADEPALAPLLEYLSGGAPSKAAGQLTVRSVIRRNAEQDMALARLLDSTTVMPQLMQSAWNDIIEWWSASPAFPPASGAEWYLRVRDFLYRSSR